MGGKMPVADETANLEAACNRYCRFSISVSRVEVFCWLTRYRRRAGLATTRCYKAFEKAKQLTMWVMSRVTHV